MKRIESTKLFEYYYNKLQIDSLFIDGMKKEIELIKFEKNEYICVEGEELEKFMFFMEGKAKVFKILQNGKSILLSFYKPLQVIGDMEVVKDQLASSTIQALSDCYCISIPMNKVREELAKDSSFLRFICESLAGKLSVISVNSSINLLYPLENRLASYLNELPVIIDGYTSKEYIEIDDSLVDVAELLGSSYRHLLRTFSNLCSKGILQKDKKGYYVINRSLLVKLAEDLYKDTNLHIN